MVVARRLRVACGVVTVLLGGARVASAQPVEPVPVPADDATVRGREAFGRGLALARQEQWGEALAAFEQAAAARAAPVVDFNIAYCLRALGRYVSAREITRRVLAHPEGLAPQQVDDARGYLTEFEGLIAEVKVTLEPPSAELTVDARPLAPSTDAPDLWLGSIQPPGAGQSLGARVFRVSLDPGVHMFRATRPGHTDAMVQRSYRPGERASLDLRLDILPATVAVNSDPGQGIVRVDGREVGLAPIEFQRPAGAYQLEVERDGYETYTTKLDLAPGQRADLTAQLLEYETPITEEWWFWTTIGGVLAGGSVLTYFLARPAPEPPPYEGGTTGWVVQPQAIRF